nr:AAA family ATPase [uncultured Fusobacterium sp.]
MRKKRIPLGKSDFKEIIEGNYYYCDKTKLIEDILDKGFEVNLFTRPRRFGKTLNMSTLKYFFDVRNAEENRKLFKDLYIEKSGYFDKQGQYPVILISFKDLSANNWKAMTINIKEAIRKLFNEHSYLFEDLIEIKKEVFEKILRKTLDIEELKNILQFLTEILYEKYNKKVVVLIDEYDTPLISAYTEGYYKEAIPFFKTLYSSVLKDNKYLELGIMTGILQVAKEGIFSGLNNIKVYNILGDNYSSYFGLVQEEVEKALVDFELEDNIEDVKTWYDGYRFGNTEIYNPWSILYYLDERQLGAYWVNTSSNDLIIKLLKQSGNDVFKELKILFSDGMIEKSINKNFNFNEMNNSKGLWELFVFSGYLKLEKKVNKDINDDLYLLKIPNLEVKTFFHRSFIESFLDSMDTFREMLNALKKKDEEIFTERLQTIFNVSISYYDVGKEEKYYHNILLGMILSLQKEYDITSNRESGSGRYDIVLEPKDRNKTAFVLEFKVGDNEEELEKLSIEAIEQIKKKEYASSMKFKGINDILGVGIAFYKKKIRVKFEEI